jgi:hypothetical protein
VPRIITCHCLIGLCKAMSWAAALALQIAGRGGAGETNDRRRVLLRFAVFSEQSSKAFRV